MSTTLATQNLEAVANIEDARPLPSVGWWVVYYGRPGEFFQGHQGHPALVMASDSDNWVLNLLVFRGVEDFTDQDRVPRRQGDERGWDYIAGDSVPAVVTINRNVAQDTGLAENIAAVEKRLENFMEELSEVFFGEQQKPEVALLDQFEEIKARLVALETKKSSGRVKAG